MRGTGIMIAGNPFAGTDITIDSYLSYYGPMIDSFEVDNLECITARAYRMDRESWVWPVAQSLYRSYKPKFILQSRKLLVSMSGWVARKAKKIKRGN